MMGWTDGWGVGSWIGMSLMMLVFWGGLIALVVWLIRSSQHQHDRQDQHPVNHLVDPTQRGDELLAERFARGEIDEDEFTRRRDLLHQP
jgi:putative membrane protein